MKIFQHKTKRVIKPVFRYAALAALLILAAAMTKPALIVLAKFLELPRSHVRCDAIIIESGPAFSEYFVTQALQAYYSGQAKKIIMVLHSYDLKPTIFGIRNYRTFVESALDSLGIAKQDVMLLLPDIQDPYTYNSAVALADTLRDIHSVLVFNDNFHIRRSYLTYKKIFAAKNIAVYPYTYEIYLNSSNWWTSANGWRRVIDEYIKLIFYWIKGYI